MALMWHVHVKLATERANLCGIWDRCQLLKGV
jgi:hypothetical protein